jgi:adenosylhomocysteine nucleosidase
MLLRWLVQNYLREAAEGKVREVFSGVIERDPQQRSSARKEGQAEPDGEELTGGEESAGDGPGIIPCDVAFIFGSGLEAGGLVDALKGSETSRHAHGTEHAGKLDGREVVIVESGVGGKAAARAVREAIKFYEPQWVISAGFATALCEELRRGQVLMAEEVASPAGEKLATGITLEPHIVAATRGLHVGRLLTVDDVVRKPAERRELREQHHALACDMETFAVAAACREAGAKLISVRLITDAVDDELPPEIEHLLAQKTIAAKIGATAGALLNRFSAAKDLWRLREDALKGSDRLAKFLRGVTAQLK